MVIIFYIYVYKTTQKTCVAKALYFDLWPDFEPTRDVNFKMLSTDCVYLAEWKVRSRVAWWHQAGKRRARRMLLSSRKGVNQPRVR